MTESPPEYNEIYRTDHPVDYCPSCNTDQDVEGIRRTDVTHTSVTRATEDATRNQCEMCDHTWINIHRPTPDDYPASNIYDFEQITVTDTVIEYIEKVRQLTARTGFHAIQALGFLTLLFITVCIRVLEHIDPDGKVPYNAD